MVDEFGSLFDSNIEDQCFHDIVLYMTNQGAAAAYPHADVENWFYWRVAPCLAAHPVFA